MCVRETLINYIALAYVPAKFLEYGLTSSLLLRYLLRSGTPYVIDYKKYLADQRKVQENYLEAVRRTVRLVADNDLFRHNTLYEDGLVLDVKKENNNSFAFDTKDLASALHGLHVYQYKLVDVDIVYSGFSCNIRGRLHARLWDVYDFDFDKNLNAGARLPLLSLISELPTSRVTDKWMRDLESYGLARRVGKLGRNVRGTG